MRRAPVVIGWRETAAASPTAPLRLLEAPGLALLRQNLPAVRVETNPRPIQLERIARARPAAVLAVFGADGLATALGACTQLAAAGQPPIVVRGRWLGAQHRDDVAAASFDGAMLPWLQELGVPLPQRWLQPMVVAELWHPRHSGVRLGLLCAALPDAGVLDLADLFGGADEGAPPSTLPGSAADDPEIEGDRLLGAYARAGLRGVLVVDNGPGAAALAERAARRGMLGGWLGPADAPWPAAVVRARVPVWTWFGPEHATAGAMQSLSARGPTPAPGVAFVPVALPDEDLPHACARTLALRELGYRAIVPRCFVPVPNTRRWQQLEQRHGLREHRFERLDGEHLVFALPQWAPLQGHEVLALLREGNVWPDPALALGHPRRSTSFEAMRQSLDAYLLDAITRVPQCHARDVLATLLESLGPAAAQLQPTDAYPFVSLGGRNLADEVERAIEARLASLAGLPAEILAALRHAALTGGKRIRPVLTLVIACAHGVPLDAVMPAALATEWLHTASLIQDDLPCMDDDDVRRRDAATHRRHGEAAALLASDALVALAFEDVAALAEHAAVGPARAARLVRALASATGGEGLVGGQALDLLTRRTAAVGLQDVLEVHRRKTVPLFELTATLATILADVPEPHAAELRAVLASLGLAFQVIDDILDATPDNDAFGRPAGSDARNNLPTFATLMGTAAGRRWAQQLMAPHLQLLDGKPQLLGLSRLATYVLERRQ